MRKSSKKASAVISNVPAIIDINAETIANDVANLETVSSAEARNGLVLDNDTGETVEPIISADATEAKPDPRAERAKRVAADREAVSILYASFEANRASVPVKAISAFKLATSTAHPIARNVSVRQCAALAVAFAAAGKKLQANAKAPRVFEINGVPSAIENGVIRDAISSGLITVTGDTPETEILILSKNAAKAITANLGETLLNKAFAAAA